MITSRLWAFLTRAPAANPIFRRELARGGPGMPWYTGCAELFAFLLIIPMFVLTSFAYSLGWTVGIAGNSARAREDGLFPLLALTPYGPLGTSLLFAASVLYRNNTFVQINSRNTWIGRTTILALLYVVLVLTPLSVTAESIIPGALWLAAIAAAAIIDHMHTIVLAVIVGMLTPTLSRDSTTAQLLAFAVFLSAQIATYLLTALAILLPVPALLAHAGMARDALLALQLGLGVVVFYALREALILALWSWLVRQLNAAAELDLAHVLSL